MPFTVCAYNNQGNLVMECKLCKCMVEEKNYEVKLRTCKACLAPWRKQAEEEYFTSDKMGKLKNG